MHVLKWWYILEKTVKIAILSTHAPVAILATFSFFFYWYIKITIVYYFSIDKGKTNPGCVSCGGITMIKKWFFYFLHWHLHQLIHFRYKLSMKKKGFSAQWKLNNFILFLTVTRQKYNYFNLDHISLNAYYNWFQSLSESYFLVVVKNCLYNTSDACEFCVDKNNQFAYVIDF